MEEVTSIRIEVFHHSKGTNTMTISPPHHSGGLAFSPALWSWHSSCMHSLCICQKQRMWRMSHLAVSLYSRPVSRGFTLLNSKMCLCLRVTASVLRKQTFLQSSQKQKVITREEQRLSFASDSAAPLLQFQPIISPRWCLLPLRARILSSQCLHYRGEIVRGVRVSF